MIITFFVTLALILTMFGIKLYEIKRDISFGFTRNLKTWDSHIQGFWSHIRHEASFLTWNNLVLLIKYVSRSLHDRVLIYKKRLDSRQPRFLIATTPNSLAHKNRKSPSNFLKAIGEHNAK